MSDRYRFDDTREQTQPLDIRLPRELQAERVDCHEDTPLQLTRAQRDRLWLILEDEVGPLSATKIMERIESAV